MNKEVAKRDYLTEFRSAFLDGMNGIVKAAQIYVEAIDAHPELVDKFAAEFEDCIPASAWAGFEAVGRKWQHPKLLMGGGGRYANRIKRLAYSTQEQIFTGQKFDLLIASGDSLKVDVRQVTPEQADQLFDTNHIRSLSEQKMWTEAEKVKRQEESELMPYVICDGKVSFRRGVTLSRTEIKRLLTEM